MPGRGPTKLPTGAVSRMCAPVLAIAIAAACQPTVRVEAPREPITINLNIKLEADVRLRVEEQAKKDINGNPEIF